MRKKIVLGLLAGSLSLGTFPMSEETAAPTTEQAPVVKPVCGKNYRLCYQ